VRVGGLMCACGGWSTTLLCQEHRKSTRPEALNREQVGASRGAVAPSACRCLSVVSIKEKFFSLFELVVQVVFLLFFETQVQCHGGPLGG